MDFDSLNSCVKANYSNSLQKNTLMQFKNNLNMLYINAQSIRNKLPEFEAFVHSLQIPIQIIVVTEIWLKKNENQFFNIHGYNSFFSNRDSAFGGVAIYIKSNIEASQIFEEEFQKSNLLMVKLPKLNCYVLGIYRHFSTSLSEFTEKLDNITTKFKNTFIFGDFNINLLDKNSNHVKHYQNTLNSNGYIIINKISSEFATRVTSHSKTIIDHFTTDQLQFTYNFFLDDSALSDHKIILISCNQNIPRQETANIELTVLDYSSLDVDPFWDNLLHFTNFDIFIEALTALINRHSKLISKKLKWKKIWMTSEIFEAIEVRDAFAKFSKKYPNDPKVQQLFSFHKSEVKRLILLAKQKYCDEKYSKYAGNPKKLWSLYKEIISNNSSETKSSIKSIKGGNTVYETDDEISNYMNDFFINITSNLGISTAPIDEIYFSQFQRTIFNQFELSATTTTEVNDIIKSLKSCSATGIDSISTKFLKKYSDRLCPVLVKLINNCFLQSKFPESLKRAVVIPVYKEGDNSDPNNYRPISILPSLSKVFEKVVQARLRLFLNNNSILHEHQYGFEDNSNTTAACLALTDNVTKSIDKKMFTACLFLDLKKAFDCVNHDVLLLKLSKLNFTANQIKFFESYLKNRTQSVKTNSLLSILALVLKGVPQGSILGPILFKIFIDDIARIKLKGSIILFADDAVIAYSENPKRK
jgi:exonuclease III